MLLSLFTFEYGPGASALPTRLLFESALGGFRDLAVDGHRTASSHEAVRELGVSGPVGSAENTFPALPCFLRLFGFAGRLRQLEPQSEGPEAQTVTAPAAPVLSRSTAGDP